MKLTIISPREIQEFAILWIELNAPTGNFVIQQGHAPMILILQPHQPIIFELNNGKQKTLTVPEGIAEITRTSITILMNKYTS
jgi:F0F1-type ATP synthase epsilon subunit